MNANFYRFPKATIRATAVLAGLVVAACGGMEQTSLQQVQMKNPSTAYKYHNDQELVQANQNAALFCNRYQSIARMGNITNETDGSKIVNFECIPLPPLATLPPQYNPALPYNYRTDIEMLDASRNAQIYCMNNGFRQVVPNVVINPNGTRSYMYQCSM